MTKINSFEDLIVWQASQEVSLTIIKLYQGSKMYFFRDQISRAALSISNNIAEGHERGSTRDYIRFLSFAKASCAEVRSMLYLAQDLNPEYNETIIALLAKCHSISKMLTAIIMKLKARIRKY